MALTIPEILKITNYKERRKQSRIWWQEHLANRGHYENVVIADEDTQYLQYLQDNIPWEDATEEIKEEK
jgi:hypothetical protein